MSRKNIKFVYSNKITKLIKIIFSANQKDAFLRILQIAAQWLRLAEKKL